MMNSCNHSYQRSRELGGRMELEHLPIGMTYVPMQTWQDLYQLEDGFQCGTIFKELNLPFTGRRVC